MQFLRRFCKVLLINFTSRKLWMSLGALFYERWDYWGNVKMIYSFPADGAAQLAAFQALNSQHAWLVGAIVGSYLGLATAAGFSKGAAASAVTLLTGKPKPVVRDGDDEA